MARNAPISIQIPLRDEVAKEDGKISRSWENFFKYLQNFIDPLGYEKFFELQNNNAVEADIQGLSFSKENASQGTIEYLIQRVTTGGGATELISSGVLHAVYKPTTAAWDLFTPFAEGPSASGITFSITTDGQVQYTSSNVTGSASISKISFRVRILSGKNSQYSQVEG